MSTNAWLGVGVTAYEVKSLQNSDDKMLKDWARCKNYRGPCLEEAVKQDRDSADQDTRASLRGLWFFETRYSPLSSNCPTTEGRPDLSERLERVSKQDHGSAGTIPEGRGRGRSIADFIELRYRMLRKGN